MVQLGPVRRFAMPPGPLSSISARIHGQTRQSPPRFDLGCLQFGHPLGQLPQCPVQFYVLIDSLDLACGYRVAYDRFRCVPRLTIRLE